jgi:toxin ParE1/3/4
LKPASLRPQAKHDLAAQSEHYAREGGVKLGDDFLAVALVALAQVEAMPGIASPRIGSAVGVCGLRSWHLSKYPPQWLFIERTDHLAVLRLLADRQDIENLLRAAAGTRLRPRLPR